MEHSVRATEGEIFSQSMCSHCIGLHPTGNYFRERERIREIRYSVFPSMHKTLKISILNVTTRSQIRASDVEQIITGFQIIRNRKFI